MRFESGQITLRRDWETLDDLVGTALDQLDERLRGRRVEVQLPPDLPAVHVDGPLVVQLLRNLLDNAAKYTPPGSGIQVAATADDPYVRVTVDDEGAGLPPGDPARLFDKFQRGQEEGTVVGVGLGLAICRAIVLAHGGTIEARNRAGGGARFEFTLPVVEQTQ
jgi:two-component system sensor histidine kinase KdpD